ncbi:hypothetical protein [Streptomyces sp. NPDC056294]|uniref:hypothetical protein n=1 Tax=Streptomyces sp. NPDC056294 TaxID=3345773 RepID=UPI0035E3A3C9
MYDWVLTVDTLIALKATGADEAAADEVVDTLKAHVRDHNSFDAWGEPGRRVSGATAKLLYAAVISGEDPTAFGAYDLRRETLDLVAGPEKGLEEGRVKDKVDGGDSSDTFGQSLAVLGLARSGDVPQRGEAFVCRIEGKPTAATEACVNTPPASAHWSYWHAPDGGNWAYSQSGASGSKPAQGSFEGWSFSLNKTSTTNPAPRVAPVRP